MGASKKARRVRTAGEFDVARLVVALRPQYDTGPPINGWSVEQVYRAREAQMRGEFELPARMAEQTRSDAALAVPFWNRLAPQKCIATKMVPARGAKSDTITAEADAHFGESGVALSAATRASLHTCLVDHGVAFAYNTWLPREDGTRIDFEVRHWPIEFVRWDPLLRMFMARVDLQGPVERGARGWAQQLRFGEAPIVHGDGRWTIFANHQTDPFRHDAALVPAALVWASHAFAMKDWNKGSVSHGNAKLVGELPEGVDLQEKDADTGATKLTADASAMLEMLQIMATADAPIGIRPAGSKMEVVANPGTAWQVWERLADKGEKAAARIYLGTDGTLGSSGGAPGVDVTALFGVALTKVQGDLTCMSRGITEGMIEPWCAVNFGSSGVAPRHAYDVPNEDAEAVAEARQKRKAAFHADLKAARENGFAITQDFVDELAEEHDVDAPTLAAATGIALAPTDVAKVVRVNEARGAIGLGPLQFADGTPDPDGELSVAAYDAKAAAARGPSSPATLPTPPVSPAAP